MSAISIGVAAHITAASKGGPRFDQTLTSDARSSVENAIWLCQSCSRLIDVDAGTYTVEALVAWKEFAEAAAKVEVQGFQVVKGRSFRQLEEKYPFLVGEMRDDLANHSDIREIVLLAKGWSYNGDPHNPVLCYFFEDHPNLKGKMKVFCNFGAAQEITHNNVDRFELSEDFVEYLQAG